MTNETEDNKSKIPSLLPRDILTPAATLLGFILTSLSIAVSFASQQPEFLKNFFLIIAMAIFLIVISAFLTILASFSGNRILWRISLISYGTTWLFLGLITLIILIGSIYGVESLNIQLPQFNVELVIGVSSTIGALISSILSLFLYRKYKVEFKTILEKFQNIIPKNNTIVKEQVKNIMNEENSDNVISFIKIVINIENILRNILILIPEGENLKHSPIRLIIEELVKQKLIDDNISKAFLSIWKIRNVVIHGGKVDKNEINFALDIGAAILLELEDVYNKLRTKSHTRAQDTN